MGLQGKEVLIIDDTADVRFLSRKIAESAGMFVSEADSVFDALNALEKGSPHLILLDLRMPGGTGFDFLEARKNDQALRSIPVIVVTSSKEIDSVYRARALGTTDDDPIFNKIVSSVFKKYGIDCETFSSSSAFLARLEQCTPALCLIDLNIETIAHALELGADDYLVKPLDRDVLISKLMNYFSSDQLDSAAMNLPAASQISFRASLEIDFSVLELDELGLRVKGSSLIPKGTVLSFTGAILREFSQDAKPILLTATSNWVEPDKNSYGAYLEFDRSNAKLARNIRNWILQRTA
jgi:CheY-like chemotaxis protein